MTRNASLTLVLVSGLFGFRVVPLAAEECSPRHLAAQLGATATGKGNELVAVVVKNSGGACTLQGSPDVRFLDSRGKDLNINETKNSGSSLSYPLKGERFHLGAGEAGTFFLAIETTPGAKEVCPEVSQLAIHARHGHEAAGLDLKIRPCRTVDVLPFVPGALTPAQLGPYQIKPYVR